jgi:hypothetical protein
VAADERVIRLFSDRNDCVNYVLLPLRLERRTNNGFPSIMISFDWKQQKYFFSPPLTRGTSVRTVSNNLPELVCIVKKTQQFEHFRTFPAFAWRWGLHKTRSRPTFLWRRRRLIKLRSEVVFFLCQRLDSFGLLRWRAVFSPYRQILPSELCRPKKSVSDYRNWPTHVWSSNRYNACMTWSSRNILLSF